MRSSPRARAVFLLLYGALLAWQVERWLFTSHGLASTWAARPSNATVSAGSPAGISQTFVMGADGLDGVWLRPTAVGRPRGELVVDLHAVHENARVRLERVVLPAADAIRSTALRVPFRLVRESRGRMYQLDVRHVRAGDGPAIDLRITHHDVLRDGQLFADRREQWGDLVLETSSRRATLPYWIHEVLRPWPAWISTWPAIAFALIAFNVVLAWACAHAAGLGGSIAPAKPSTMTAPQTRAAATRAAVAAVVLVAITGIAIAGRPAPRCRSLDLIEALPDARLETTWPSLHAGLAPEAVVFSGRVHRAIVALPTSTIAWAVDVPRGAVLRVGAAMRADMWDRPSDGIQMTVTIEHAGERTVAADLTLFPMGVPAHRALMPLELPLHRWAGQRITIVLRSTPERWGNAVNDVPVWIEPRIEWPRHPPADVARVFKR